MHFLLFLSFFCILAKFGGHHAISRLCLSVLRIMLTVLCFMALLLLVLTLTH
jgi:hypothetical protein